MVGALTANAWAAAGNPVYLWLFVAQLALYALAAVGWTGIGLPLVGGIARLAAYFVATNIAFGIAWFKWMRGEKMAMWKPRAG